MSGEVFTFRDSWFNQFYTKGDLVRAILEGDVSVTSESLLCVLLAPLIADVTAGNIGLPNALVSKVDGSTGAMSSYNLINPNVVNYISGTIDVYMGDDQSAWFIPLAPGLTSTVLPNGLLQLGSCGAARATDWISILRTLSLNMPQEVLALLEKSGRKKSSLPKGVNTISSMDSVLAEALSNGQRDGYINSPALAFNATRLTRDEQEGPLFAGGSFSDTFEGTISATPVMASNVNNWDRLDNSDGRYLISSLGKNVNIQGPTPARFTGQWDAGRIATWVSDFIADSNAMGNGNIEEVVADNLLSYPGHMSIEGQFTPATSPTWWSGFTQDMYSELANTGTDIATICDDYLEHASSVNGYGDGLHLESFHPTRGFMRGLAAFLPNDSSTWGNVATPADNDSQETRGRLTLDGTSFPDPEAIYVGGPMVYPAVLDADQPLGRSGLDMVMESPPCFTWHWDPSRVQIFGSSWHRWAGHQFGGILPHPYALHPVAVSTATMRMSDICGVEATTESPVSASLSGLQESATFQSLNGITDGTNLTVSLATLGDMLETQYGLIGGLRFNNKSSSWGATVGNLLIDDADTRLQTGAAVASLYDGLVATKDSMEVLPTWEMAFSVMNGCQRIPYNAACASGIMGSSLVCTGMLGFGPSTPNLVAHVEGEVLYPTVALTETNGSTDARVGSLSQASCLAINGKGILFEGDVYTSNFLKLNSWMVRTYSGDQSLVNGPIDGFWSPYTNNGLLAAAAPGVGVNFGASAPAVTVFKPAISGVLEVNPVQNDWFRKDDSLSPKHARMRSSEIVAPWIRAPGESGYVHMRYENSGLSPLYTQNQRVLNALGQKLQQGLTNSLFLEVQTAN